MQGYTTMHGRGLQVVAGGYRVTSNETVRKWWLRHSGHKLVWSRMFLPPCFPFLLLFCSVLDYFSCCYIVVLMLLFCFECGIWLLYCKILVYEGFMCSVGVRFMEEYEVWFDEGLYSSYVSMDGFGWVCFMWDCSWWE